MSNKKEAVNTILVRQLSSFDSDVLIQLMTEFDEKTASQTVIKLIRSYADTKKRLESFEKLNATLMDENNDLRRKLENLRKSLKDIELNP